MVSCPSNSVALTKAEVMNDCMDGLDIVGLCHCTFNRPNRFLAHIKNKTKNPHVQG